jgi:hypothetical protein
MKVDVAGLIAAAQRLIALATSVEGVQGAGPGEHRPLGADTTSFGAAARIDAAALQLWGSACAQAYSLHTAAAHLVMIAAKFGGQEEINKAGLTMLLTPVSVLNAGALATLAPVPPITPDVRAPLPPLQPDLTGELFSQLVTTGSSTAGAGFGTTATTNGHAVESAALAVRDVAATVPELWESPEGTSALSGRLLEHATALTTIADRWFELADEARKHADDHSQTVAAVPKPQEFKENEAALRQAQTEGNGITASQLIQQRGVLQQRALAEAQRYAGVTETTTSPNGMGTPTAPGAGVPAGGSPAGAPAGARAASAPGDAPLTKAAASAGGAAQAGQAGDAAGQLAQLLPAALGAIGGLAGGAAGMVGQIPQALMQSGQGLAQAATQGLSGLASQKSTDAEVAKSVGGPKPDELAKAKAGGGAGGGGGGDTHPAGALGPAVTPSTSHTPPAVPAGASGGPPAPTPGGGSAMGAMPMGMPLGGLMPHGGQGGDGAGGRVPAEKKVVVPPQPHTEPVTGRVSDRTAAAAEASRTRAESDDPDDESPRGPVIRRITLAPLQDDRP